MDVPNGQAAPAPQGKTVFQDGMRVSREHLDNLQDILQAGIRQLREAAGLGKVVYGLKAEAGADGSVQVAPGLALDDFGRAIMVPSAQTLTPDFSLVAGMPMPSSAGMQTPAGTDSAAAGAPTQPSATGAPPTANASAAAPAQPSGDGPAASGSAPVLYAVAAHNLLSGLLAKGIPTVLTDGFKVELRGAPPPYADGGVRFAELRPGAEGIDIVQNGDWYLPPLDHGHSGKFVTDARSHLRFDGHALGFAGPLYDSGFITLPLGGKMTLKHGLLGRDFLAQLEARLQDGTITNRGSGREYWYDLPADGIAVLARTKHKEYDQFRLRLWPFGSAGTSPPGPVLPIADAGPDAVEELGHSFELDGSGSRSPAALKLTRFKWVQLS